MGEEREKKGEEREGEGRGEGELEPICIQGGIQGDIRSDIRGDIRTDIKSGILSGVKSDVKKFVPRKPWLILSSQTLTLCAGACSPSHSFLAPRLAACACWYVW